MSHALPHSINNDTTHSNVYAFYPAHDPFGLSGIAPGQQDGQHYQGGENAEFAHFMRLTRGLRDRMGRGGPRGNFLAALSSCQRQYVRALRLGPTSSFSAVSRLESSSRVTRPGKQLLRAWSVRHRQCAMSVWVGNARQAFVSAGGDPQPSAPCGADKSRACHTMRFLSFHSFFSFFSLFLNFFPSAHRLSVLPQLRGSGRSHLTALT